MLLDIFPVKEMILKSTLSVYGFINVWHHNIRLSLDPILKTFEIGGEAGYHEYAVVSLSIYYHLTLFSGINLLIFNDEIEEFSKIAPQSPVMKSVHRLVLTFLSNEESYRPSLFLDKVGDEMNTFLINLHTMIVSYNFYEYDSAAQIIQSSKPFQSNIHCMYAYAYYIFYQGLVSIAQLRNQSTALWKQTVKQSVSQLEIWCRSSQDNFLNKLHLLIAEDLSITSTDFKAVLSSYDESIKLARRFGLTHEEALASELCGLYCIKRSFFAQATKYLSHAFASYEKWSCKSKMNQLKSTVGDYVKDPSEHLLDIFDESDNGKDVYIDVSSAQSTLSGIM